MEIRSQLDYFINREKWLQNSVSQLRQQIIASKRPNPVSSFVPDTLGIIAREALGIPYSGKYARKIARSLMSNHNPQFQNQEQSLEIQHDSLIQEICLFLEGVSVNKTRLSEPNSHLLIQRIKSSQSFSKLQTRITRTIVALEVISGQPLFNNRDIEKIPKQSELSEQLSYLPRLTILRREIPEIEPPFREFLRKNMKREYGDTWENQIQSKFLSSFGKWQHRMNRRGGKDVLDAMQFGELVNVLNAFSQVKAKLGDPNAVNLSLSIVQNERAILIHPSDKAEVDLGESRFQKIDLALKTLKDSFS